MRPTITREYCHAPGCVGRDGVEVPWTPSTDFEPGWPDIDSCPHCGSDLHQQAPDDEEEGEE